MPKPSEARSRPPVISIPYGSIKSPPTISAVSALFLFQFLMVRLKVDAVQRFELLDEISIPYGSIKSKKLTVGAEIGIPFQFLMVRLKEHPDV